jgi:hypothetical protein
MYSKSNGIFGISGDLKESVRAVISAEIKAVKGSDMDDEEIEHLVAKLTAQYQSIDNGIDRPFVSIMGFTTPSSYEQIMLHDTVNNGFIGRAIFVEESETNPRMRVGIKPTPIPFTLQRRLAGLRDGGDYDMSGSERVERVSDFIEVKTDPAGQEMIAQIAEWQWLKAEESKEQGNGLEATWRRTLELVNKVSLTLAMDEGVRTAEHIAWAFEYIRHINERKINMALSLTHAGERVSSSNVVNKIMSIVTDEPVTEGVIVNRCRPHAKKDVLKCLESLVAKRSLFVRPHGKYKPTRIYGRGSK